MTDVTDADRELAWSIGVSFDSQYDAEKVAELAARHREASIAPYVEALRALVKDFRWRSRMCRTNADAFDTKAAAVWDFAADAVQAQIDALLPDTKEQG